MSCYTATSTAHSAASLTLAPPPLQILPGFLLCFVRRFDQLMPSPTQLKWTCCKAYTKLSYFQASLLGYGIGESHSALCCTLTALLTTHTHSTPHTTPSQHSSHNTFTQHSSHNTPHNTLTQYSSQSILTQHSSHNTLTQHYSHNTLTALIMMRIMCQPTAVSGLPPSQMSPCPTSLQVWLWPVLPPSTTRQRSQPCCTWSRALCCHSCSKHGSRSDQHTL